METKGEEQVPNQMIELHPYEYLTKLNTINSTCNRANNKSYSSASRIKLPWKPFNLIKIPQYFQRTYGVNKKMAKRESEKEEGPVDGIEKKMWKEHKQILAKHIGNKENFQNSFRPKTAYKERKALAEETLGKNKMSQNFFLQKVVQKGGQFSYDKDELKDQVLSKLKKISTATNSFNTKNSHNSLTRVKSAFIKSAKHKKPTLALDQTPQISFINSKPCLIEKQSPNKERRCVIQQQFLSFEKSEDLLAKYKQNIRQVDCSISDMNVKKTVSLLKNMKNIADGLL